MAPLAAENLSLSYGSTPILQDISLALPEGQITAIVGPNACGKSSLLRCLARLQDPSAGVVLLNGTAIRKQKTRDVARQLAVLPQSTIAPAGMKVIDLVLRGRTPHQSPLQQYSAKDHQRVAEALDHVGLAHRQEAYLEDLSGGQLQRAWIAMVLAQDTKILLLDEPTTFLDMPHQLEIMQLVRDLHAARGLTVAMVLHDINLAARFCDQIVAIKDRAVLCQGSPTEVITEDNIEAIYGLGCSVIADPHHGHPHIILK